MFRRRTNFHKSLREFRHSKDHLTGCREDDLRSFSYLVFLKNIVGEVHDLLGRARTLDGNGRHRKEGSPSAKLFEHPRGPLGSLVLVDAANTVRLEIPLEPLDFRVIELESRRDDEVVKIDDLAADALDAPFRWENPSYLFLEPCNPRGDNFALGAPTLFLLDDAAAHQGPKGLVVVSFGGLQNRNLSVTQFL